MKVNITQHCIAKPTHLQAYGRPPNDRGDQPQKAANSERPPIPDKLSTDSKKNGKIREIENHWGCYLHGTNNVPIRCIPSFCREYRYVEQF